MAYFIFEDTDGKKRRVEIAKSPFYVGKRKDCELVLTHTEVSRRHLEVTKTEKGYFAKDLGSTNGTRVNGERLATKAKELPDGCVVELGGFAMVFQDRVSMAPDDSEVERPTVMAGPPRAAAAPPPAAAAAAAPAASPIPPRPKELPGDDLAGKPLTAYLKKARDLGASDLHLTVGAPPFVRLQGQIRYFAHPVVTQADLDRHLTVLLDRNQLAVFHEKHDLDFCHDVRELGRFRVNAHAHNVGAGVSLRVLSDHTPTLRELGLPDILRKFTMYNQGIVLLTGPAGCGKSSTMAALVEIVNREKRKQIITLEDPIEYAFVSKSSTVIQREIRKHTETWAGALRSALREDPDVIMIGELRDLETIEVAITAAETGHLVFGTLHTLGVIKTVDRLLDVFPPKEQSRIRVMLSESLRGVVSQQLIPAADGTRRVAALEILFTTSAIANLIREEKTHQMLTQLQTGKKLGMRMMDDSLQELFEAGTITRDEALSRTDDPKRFEVKEPQSKAER